MTPCPRWVSAIGVLALLALPRRACSQAVQGFVRDSVSGEGVAGAVVSALGPDRVVVARVISDARGHYHLPLDRVAFLQTLRIGFRPRLIPAPAAGADTARLDIALNALPQLLDRVVVRENALCSGTGDQSVALALWEQARSALLANAIARQDSAETHTLRVERARDAATDTILDQTFRRVAGPHIAPFVAAYAASEFATRGYMLEDSTGRTFNAPDVDVLLDQGFVDTHCFDVAYAAGRPGQVGLHFRPARDRNDLVDITGTLWMTTQPPALRELEFTYTSLEPAAIAARSGGRMTFREMRPGVVFIDHWTIRSARLATDARRLARLSSIRSRRSEVVLAGVFESGGDLVSARWKDGVHWENSLGRMDGEVIADSGRSPRGANRLLVTIRGSNDSTGTDSLGRFTLRDLLAGPLIIVVSDTAYAAYGFPERRSFRATLTPGAPLRVQVPWQSIEQRARDACAHEVAGKPDSSRLGVLAGRVLLPNGMAAVGSKIHVEAFPDPTHRNLDGPRPTIPPDTRPLQGASFVSCGIVPGEPVLLQAAHPAADTTAILVQLSAGEVVHRVDLRLLPKPR